MMRPKKLGYLSRLMKIGDIIGLQEVHGTELRFLAEFKDLRAQEDFHVFSSFSNNSTEAGVVTLLRSHGTEKSAFSSSAAFQGRALRTVFRSSDGSVASIIWNIHNFGLSTVQAKHLCRLVTVDTDFIAERPLDRSIIVMGDWNCLPVGEARIPMKTPESKPIHNDNYTGEHTKVMLDMVKGLVDLAIDTPTRYDS